MHYCASPYRPASACIGVCKPCVGRVAMCGFWKIDFHTRNVFAHANTRHRADLHPYVRHMYVYTRATDDVQEVGSQLHSRRHACRSNGLGRASIVPSSFRYPLSSTGRHCRRFSSEGNLLNVTLEDQEQAPPPPPRDTAGDYDREMGSSTSQVVVEFESFIRVSNDASKYTRVLRETLPDD